jgi:iron complex outermembrane receptor protein
MGFVLLAAAGYAQQTTLQGTVSDKNAPIQGAFIRILNTTLGTATDVNGNFTLALRPGNYTLYITAIGYADRQQTINFTGSETLTITLSESSIELDDIVVTAQKEEANIQSVPFSISALSGKKINEYRIWNSKDITAITPNLYSANPGDNRNVTSIRGITSSSYDPAVATYIDGVNQFTLDTYIAPLFDVERIEVLRGPQGTLYGRNAMGGVINIITKQPTNTLRSFVEASVGSAGQQRYIVGVRGPVVADKLFFGISGMFDGANGFYTNDVDNSNFDKRKSYTGNYYLRWNISNDWSMTLNAKHHHNRNNGSFALNSSPQEAFEKPFHLTQNARTTLVDNSVNASLLVSHTGSSLYFSSLTTAQSNHRYYDDPIDGDFSEADIITIINNYGKKWNNVKVFTQEFKLSSPINSSSPFKWTAGTYLFMQDSPNKQTTHFGENGDLYGAQPNTSIVNTIKAESKGIAFFGQATYSFAKKVDLTFGLRYDYERKNQSVHGDYLMDPSPEPVFETQPDTSATVSFNAISPRLSATWHITENHHAYVVGSRGFRTGGLTQLSSDPSQPPLYAYKPEYSGNVEVGIKNNFLDNKVKLNAALFYLKVVDAQIPTLVLPDAFTITKNAGELTSQGLELEASATPFKKWQIDYNLGFTDATYSMLVLPSGGDEINLEGNRQIFTPAVTSMLALQFSQPLSSWQSLKFVARGEWFYLGEQYFDLANTIRQAPYSLLNTRFGVVANSFEVMFWGRNLTDQTYISYAYDFGGSHLGDPFNYGVSVRKSF